MAKEEGCCERVPLCFPGDGGLLWVVCGRPLGRGRGQNGLWNGLPGSAIALRCPQNPATPSCELMQGGGGRITGSSVSEGL